MTERIQEQSTAIRRVQNSDRCPHPSLTWQDVDVLDSINKALKPVSEFTDILSGEKYVTTSSLLPMLQLITNEILAEADEDTALTKDLKAGILTCRNMTTTQSKS